MSRNETHLIPEGQKTFLDGVDQCSVVTPWKIRPANGAPEQNVADKSQLAFRLEEDDVTGGMTGAVVHLQLKVTQLHPIALIQPPVRLEGLHAGHTKHLALLRHTLNPEEILPVGALDGQALGPGEFPHTTRVIDVGVSNQYLLQFNILLCHRCQNSIQIATGIDHCSLAGLLAPDQAAVLLKGSYWNNGVFHLATVSGREIGAPLYPRCAAIIGLSPKGLAQSRTSLGAAADGDLQYLSGGTNLNRRPGSGNPGVEQLPGQQWAVAIR